MKDYLVKFKEKHWKFCLLKSGTKGEALASQFADTKMPNQGESSCNFVCK